MAPEKSQNGVEKGDFKERFAQRVKLFNDRHTTNEELPRKRKEESEKHLSAGILKKRETKEPEEEVRVETESTVPSQEIFGFDNEIKSMKTFLLDQKVYKEFKTLVVVGEYGVGKTALCKKIFNDDDVKSVYAPRIWVSMHSKETKVGEDKKISALKRILKDLGVEDSTFDYIHHETVEEVKNKEELTVEDKETQTEKEIAALLYALHLNLRWKKYLIVFDDVREEDNWNEKLYDDEKKLRTEKKWGKYLSDGFPKGSGGRVIYTTRDNDLAKNLVAEEHEIHRLWPLTDSENVWKIYEKALKENEQPEVPRNDKKCIDELMNKSRGLPLAVRLMATLLPVLLDDEIVPENGSSHGTTDPTSGENRTTPPLHT